VTGSPLFEVLEAQASSIASSPILETMGLAPGGYLLASMHREENVDDPANLERLLDALVGLHSSLGLRILVTTHPRLRDRLACSAGVVRTNASSLEFCDPFGYHDYVRLQQHARCVLSDSGTIAEESAILGFPAVSLRNAIERPEALDVGSLILTGLEAPAIERAVRVVIGDRDEGRRASVPLEYQVADCSSRVVRLIIGLAGLHPRWANLQPTLGGVRGALRDDHHPDLR
jgi:UDP-N-acetylglucosamine 2-epimerase (non-hydrolysing)